MQKVNVYLKDLSNLDLNDAYKKVPDFRREKADKLVSEKDRKLSIGTYLLLKDSLKKHGIEIDEFSFENLENGKPILRGCPIKFNYSHSGDFGIVAISQNGVGIDIQKITKINPKITRLMCNENDIKFIENSSDKNDALNKMFVLKEAYYKAYGATNYKDINIDYKNVKVYKIKDYYYAVAPESEIELETIN